MIMILGPTSIHTTIVCKILHGLSFNYVLFVHSIQSAINFASIFMAIEPPHPHHSCTLAWHPSSFYSKAQLPLASTFYYT